MSVSMCLCSGAHVHGHVCVHECGGQISTLDVIPQ